MRKNERAWCEPCDKDVRFYLEETTITSTINGVTFKHPFFRAHCEHCGELVSPYSITNLNIKIMYDEYKKRVGLLTSKEIIAIRKKLNLTQEGLARLMGCGLKTITRYENGAIQDRVFDNFIRCLELMHDKKVHYQQILKFQ